MASRAKYEAEGDVRGRDGGRRCGLRFDDPPSRRCTPQEEFYDDESEGSEEKAAEGEDDESEEEESDTARRVRMHTPGSHVPN